MRKLIISGILASLALAFPGMAGGSMKGKAAMIGEPIKGLKDDTILATVNGQPIRVKELNYYLQGITGDNRIRVQDLPAKHIKKFIDEYVNSKMLYEKKAKEITKTPQYKAAAMKLAVDMWLKHRLDSIKISDKEAREFYEKNKDIYFKTTPKYKARHIVVKDEKLAKKIINELKGLKGKNLEKKFAELAKKYSIGPSKVQGGELGWFDPNQMVKPFKDAVESLKVGEITKEPVKTRFGYHVILLEGKDTKAYMPYNKVKPQIVEYLKRVKLQKELREIKDSTKIEYKIPK